MSLTGFRRGFAFAFTLLLSLICFGKSTPAQNKYTTPDGATISVNLHPEKTSIVLGEPLHIIFRITNLSSREISFISGGDYRNRLGIPLSFGVSVTDEAGRKIGGPEIKVWFGGLSGRRVLKRDEFFDQDIILPFWADITKPGKYKIKVAWSLRKEVFNDPDPFPVEAETTISVALPTDQELGDLISRLDRQLAQDDHYRSFEAAYCLARITDKRTLPILSRVILELPDDDRPTNSIVSEAIRGLLQSGNEEAFVVLEKLVTHPNSYARSALLFELKENGTLKAVSLLLKFKADSNDGIRRWVAQILSTSDHPEATKVLEELLMDSEPSVREAAQRSLDLRKDQK